MIVTNMNDWTRQKKGCDSLKCLCFVGTATVSEAAVDNYQELQDLQRGFSMERRDIEDAFKLEIAELEDRHIREKNDMLKEFNQQKVLYSRICNIK